LRVIVIAKERGLISKAKPRWKNYAASALIFPTKLIDRSIALAGES